jgi:prolipoprotein diacylglyceryltransferase
VIGVGVLLWIDRRFTLRRPALFALYVIWYTTFRTFEEILRVDPSNHFAGQRVNFWVSLGVWLVAVVFFVWWQFFHERSPKEPVMKARPVPKGPRMAVPKSRVR